MDTNIWLRCLLIVTAGIYATSSIDAHADKADWPRYSYDAHNTNHNPFEKKLNHITAKHLKRAWQTFNDDRDVTEDRPTGFVLESVLGLEFPSAVVGVVAGSLVVDGTIYYVDALGTLFARDAKTGTITDPDKHWTTTLVDPDFAAGSPAVLPELVYTAPVVTKKHVWLVGSSYGRLHAVERRGGQELDFNRATPEIDPFPVISDLPFASILGDSVVVNTGPADGNRSLFITGVNVILNDALVQGQEAGVQLAIDITNPQKPVEAWRRFTIDIDPTTGARFSTGVSAGAGLAVDEYRQLIIGGTGQNTTRPYEGYPDPALAPEGFIDRSDAVYAINYVTGEFQWFNQFHAGDVFDLNNPVSTGPNQPDGPRDADVLSPPVLWTAKSQGQSVDYAGVGSKGGLYRAVDRDTGQTLWERQISQPTGIGGIQAGSAFANGVIYVAGFEGIDDGFSDAQFGTSFDTGIFGNAFFATFSPAFWADVEDTSDDNDPATGMRVKVYALDAATGESLWHRSNGDDFVTLLAGAALRHVSTANGLVFVTTSAGKLFVLDGKDGKAIYEDQTDDLNETMLLGLGKPHHAGMNSGTVISDGMLFVAYGHQNNPSGGMLAYEIDRIPASIDLIESLRESIRALSAPRFFKRALLVKLHRVLVRLRNDRIRPVPKLLANVNRIVKIGIRFKLLSVKEASRLIETSRIAATLVLEHQKQ